jgi:LPS-assembly protein
MPSASSHHRLRCACTIAAAALVLPAPMLGAQETQAPPEAMLPQPGPAELPPVPSLLDSADLMRASPYVTPLLTTPALSNDTFASSTDDTPLWVLPPSAIPKQIQTVPGAEPVRDRGYLDRPGDTAGIVTEPIEPDSDRLERGLDWSYCGARPPGKGGAQLAPPGASADTGPIDLAAGGVTYRRDENLVEAVGGVSVLREDQRVEADRLTYDRARQTITSPSATYLEYPQLRLIGEGAEINLETEQGRIDAPRFRLSGPLNVRGRADTGYVVSPSRTAYRDLLYTSCPPGSNAWSLRASQLKLDQEAGVGIARDARLRVRGVPVFYTPYLQFPIDDRRRSGFLIPSVGSSEDNGFELQTPYYWNIAPNLDATFTPRLMTERGIQLGSEFRWLTRPDAGEIRAEILPEDRAYDGDNRTRWAFTGLESGQWLGRLRTSLDFSAVSDDQYLEDLGNNIDITSTRRLRQRGDITYFGQGWSLLTRLEGFQTIDQVPATARPYGRLPQVLFRINPSQLLPEAPGRLTGRPTVGLEAEYNYFDHNHKVHGQRFTLTPVLSWPLQRSYGHLIPGARLYASSYTLSDTVLDEPDDPSHLIPSLDLDGKLIFERETAWLGDAAVQTLEPRLYYLYTPYEDQSDTPVFDSSELDFSFANLFRNNRFTGRDRIGDANQMTAGISSRMLRAATGEELFRISIGQIYYFDERRVQIFGPPQTDDTSPYTGELSAQLFENWLGRASFQWDPDADQDDSLPRRTLRLEYRDPERRMLNFAYRADLTPAAERNRYEDTDLSFRLPFGPQVEMVGRWLYSIRHDETMDAFAGVELGKCCWRLRVLGRHFKRRPEDAATTSVMLQVELAGLGAIGDPIGDFLEREIYGYSID